MIFATLPGSALKASWTCAASKSLATARTWIWNLSFMDVISPISVVQNMMVTLASFFGSILPVEGLTAYRGWVVVLIL